MSQVLSLSKDGVARAPLVQSRRYNLSFKLFVIGFVLAFVPILANATGRLGESVDSPWKYLILGASPSFLWLSVLAALAEGQSKNPKPLYRVWLTCVAAILLLLLLVGIIQGNEPKLIGFDLSIFAFFFAGLLISGRSNNWLAFDKLLTITFLVGTLLTLFAWLNLGFVPDSRPSVTWTPPYILWGETLFAWPYFLITINQGSPLRKFVAVLGIATFFIMAVLFEKRTPFLHLALFTVFLAYVNRWESPSKQIRRIGGAIFVAAALASVGWVTLNLLDKSNYIDTAFPSLVDRFSEKGTIFSIVRTNDTLVEEPELVRSQLRGYEIVLGKGLGAAVNVPYEIYGRDRVGALHNGMATLILKGGVVLIVVWLSGWLLFLVDFLRNKDQRLNPYYIPVLLVVPLFFMSNFAVLSPSLAFLMMCAGRCMNSRKSPSPYRQGSRSLLVNVKGLSTATK